jgi:hypothetical protein
VARYRFLTTWCVEAPAEQVWDAIYDAERWPEWWRGVAHARKLRDGDENDVGCVWRFGWRSQLPYTLEFESETTRVERPPRCRGLVGPRPASDTGHLRQLCDQAVSSTCSRAFSGSHHSRRSAYQSTVSRSPSSKSISGSQPSSRRSFEESSR